MYIFLHRHLNNLNSGSKSQVITHKIKTSKSLVDANTAIKVILQSTIVYIY